MCLLRTGWLLSRRYSCQQLSPEPLIQTTWHLHFLGSWAVHLPSVIQCPPLKKIETQYSNETPSIMVWLAQCRSECVQCSLASWPAAFSVLEKPNNFETCVQNRTVHCCGSSIFENCAIVAFSRKKRTPHNTSPPWVLSNTPGRFLFHTMPRLSRKAKHRRTFRQTGRSISPSYFCLWRWHNHCWITFIYLCIYLFIRSF